MAIAHVQSIGAATSGTVSSVTVTFGSTTVTDNLLVANYSYFNTAFSAIADTAGNTWTLNATLGTMVGGATPWRARSEYCKNATGTSSHAVSITFTGTVSTTIIITEISGQDLTSPLDVSQVTWAEGTTSHASGTSGATDTANELVLGFSSGQFGSTYSQDTGYTEQYDVQASLTTGSGTAQTKVVGATGTQAFNTTSSTSINGFTWLTTWREAAGAGGVVGPLLSGHLLNGGILAGRLVR